MAVAINYMYYTHFDLYSWIFTESSVESGKYESRIS